MAEIRIDTSSLTCVQFLIPGHSSAFVDDASERTLSLTPGVYGFQQQSGPASFEFEVTTDGLIDYDFEYEQFLDGRGTNTLAVRGYAVTIDGRALSHALLPLAMLGGMSELSNGTTHDLTLIPAAGYRFQAGAGIVADFGYDLTIDGQVVLAHGG